MLNLKVPQYYGQRFWNLSTIDGSIIINSTNVIDVFSKFIKYNMSFPFNIGQKSYVENDFYNVLKKVFDYPLAFNLSELDILSYSNDQLEFINKIKNKCSLDDLFDIKIKSRYVPEELQKRGYLHLFDEVKNYAVFEESILKKIPQYHSEKYFKSYNVDSGELTNHPIEYVFAFEEYTDYSLYYPFEVLSLDDHFHDFYEVILAAFYYPETFNISSKNKKYYSKIEIMFLDILISKCLEMDLHDIEKDDLYIEDELIKRNMRHMLKK